MPLHTAPSRGNSFHPCARGLSSHDAALRCIPSTHRVYGVSVGGASHRRDNPPGGCRVRRRPQRDHSSHSGHVSGDVQPLGGAAGGSSEEAGAGLAGGARGDLAAVERVWVWGISADVRGEARRACTQHGAAACANKCNSGPAAAASHPYVKLAGLFRGIKHPVVVGSGGRRGCKIGADRAGAAGRGGAGLRG